MRLRDCAALAALLGGLWPAVARAGDGVLEINQACAQQRGPTAGDEPGCFSGDTDGFPVTVAERGSYSLSSDLTPPADVVGIQIEADDVTIDLNGFGIYGDLTCVPGSCSGSGPSRGIAVPTAPLTNGRRCTVRNGKVTGINGNAIELRDEAFADAISVSNTFLNGIVLGPNSLATRNRVTSVGRSGLLLGDGSGYANNVFAKTGQFLALGSVFGGKPTGGNVCDDGLCGDGRRRFYLSQTAHEGNEVLAACAPGFHMASFYEIFDPSSLTYDTRFGRTAPDSGSGPPTSLDGSGWIRTGRDQPSSGGGPGIANCSMWTSAEFEQTGSVVRLEPNWAAQPDTGSHPWRVEAFPCPSTPGVWCVED